VQLQVGWTYRCNRWCFRIRDLEGECYELSGVWGQRIH